MIGLAALTAIAVTAQGSTSIDAYLQKNFSDASFTARVKFANQKELGKINDDFGKSYRFSYSDLKVKEPFKVRVESNVEDTKVLYILNGTQLLIRIPRVKINSRQDLAKAPGRRQTLMDFGLLTPSLFNNFMVAKFVRMDRASETPSSISPIFRLWTIQVGIGCGSIPRRSTSRSVNGMGNAVGKRQRSFTLILRTLAESGCRPRSRFRTTTGNWRGEPPLRA